MRRQSNSIRTMPRRLTIWRMPCKSLDEPRTLSVRAAPGAWLLFAEAVRDAVPQALATTDAGSPRVGFKTTGPRPELRWAVRTDAANAVGSVRARLRRIGDECEVSAWLRWESAGPPLREVVAELPVAATVRGPALLMAAKGLSVAAGRQAWTLAAPAAAVEVRVSYRVPAPPNEAMATLCA